MTLPTLLQEAQADARHEDKSQHKERDDIYATQVERSEGGAAHALRAQRAPVRMGQESLPGRHGIARSEIAPHGSVQLGGELWSADLAEGEQPIPQGAQVEVVRAEGVRLVVRKKS